MSAATVPSVPIAMPCNRIVPLIVAVALFMENMDSTVIATSLPAIAADIGTSPLALKLAITSYLLSLAVFIPVSGWTADRFGARTVFRAAIAVFMLGSIGCALSGSLTQFVARAHRRGHGRRDDDAGRRLILVRSVDKRELINAMVWVTLPALIGPLIGPPLGGFITTYISWHWIFLINIPIGLVGIVLATIFIEDVRAETPDPFDPLGMVLAGLGIGGLAFGGSVLGLNFLPTGVVARADRRRRGRDLCLCAACAAHAGAGARPVAAQDPDHARRHRRRLHLPLPASARCRSCCRCCCSSASASRAFQSGLITLSNVVGAMGMKTVDPDHPAALRLPPGADGERAGQRRAGRGLRDLHAGRAVRLDRRRADGRRLLPLARVHQPQHHRLCRRRPPPHEPRDLAGRGRRSSSRSRPASRSARSRSI